MASIENGYKISSLDQVYKGVAQRWLLVYSAKAYNTEIATLDRDKTLNSLVKRLKYHDLAIAQSISLPNIMEEESLKQNSVALCAPSHKLFFSSALKGKA